MVYDRRRLAAGDHHTDAPRAGVCRPAVVLEGRTYTRVVGTVAPPEQDYERKVQTSETLLKLAMIRLMLRRLARCSA